MNLQSLHLLFILTAGILCITSLWLLTDPRKFRERLSDSFRPRRLFFYLGETIIFGLIVVNTLWFPNWLIPENPLLLGLGFATYILGIFLLIWAKRAMGTNWNMPGQHDIGRQKKLVVDGPFSITRNPIYVGNILMFTGYLLLLQSYFVLLVPLSIVRLLWNIKKEELLLTKHFGDVYLAYKKRVPRFI